MTEFEALNQAIDALGGQSSLARVCGGNVRQQHVFNWINRSKKLPAIHALKVEAAVMQAGGNISASDLCPQMYSKSA